MHQPVYLKAVNVLQAIILGLVQGLTEFIPVSSSGHLVLLHEALGIADGGLTFDVALHVGTLLALIVYFFKDIVLLAESLFERNEHHRLSWLLVAATLPAVIAGALLQGEAEGGLRSPVVVAVNLILIALVMLVAERVLSHHQYRKTALKNITPKQALAVGAAQAVAVIPGVSRSGSTIAVGLLAGLDRVAATRFSFLLGIPITFGAIVKVLSDGAALDKMYGELGLFAVGVTAAFLSGIFAIRFLLRYLAGHTLAVFAYYRLALGLLVLLLVFV